MKEPRIQGRVYSTDSGRTCPGCGQPVRACCCSREKNRPAGEGVVRVSRQTKGRKGSGVCILSGFCLNDAELRKLAGLLKKKCGSGGTVKDGCIEIQGDHRKLLVDTLLDMGFAAKSAGG